MCTLNNLTGISKHLIQLFLIITQNLRYIIKFNHHQYE